MIPLGKRPYALLHYDLYQYNLRWLFNTQSVVDDGNDEVLLELQAAQPGEARSGAHVVKHARKDLSCLIS